MGRYDDAYKNYYNRIDDKPRIKDDKSSLHIDMEEDLLIRKSRNRNKFFDSYLNIIVVSTLVPTIMFAGVVGIKYIGNDIGGHIYNHVKKIVSTDLLYKEYILSFMDKFDVDTLLKKDGLTNLGIEMPKEKGDELATNAAINAEKEIESFNLDNNSIKFSKSDEKYKEILKSLSGNKVKAKSEEGVVLSCSYKIIVNHLAGVIENVGENASGHYLSIKHDSGVITSYYNLPNLNLKKGSSIKRGETIADIKEERDIIFKMKEDDKFIHPRMYLDFLE